MNFSRQALLGIGMILGGSVMLYAMAQQIGSSNKSETPPALVEKSSTEQTGAPELTTDVETEKRLLEQKQKARAARVAEQERRAQEFLAAQEKAETEALAKSRAENQRYLDNAAPIGGDSDSPEASQSLVTTPSVQTRQEVAESQKVAEETEELIEEADKVVKKVRSEKQAETNKEKEVVANQQNEAKKQAEAKAKKEADEQAKAEAEKKAQVEAEEQAAAKQKKQEEEKAAAAQPPTSPTDYTVKRGDGLIKLARQYNVPVEALAQANDISASTSLQVGQALTIPSRKQVERLEREAAEAKQAAEAERAAKQKLREARQEVKETDAKGSFGVQVALARNQAAADEVAEKLKAAGYQVKTSATSRGVRVIVGPERGKVAALALKDKINTDPNVDTNNAWVLYWR